MFLFGYSQFYHSHWDIMEAKSSFKDCRLLKTVLLFLKKDIYEYKINAFMHNVVKWPNIHQKSCGVTPQDF